MLRRSYTFVIMAKTKATRKKKSKGFSSIEVLLVTSLIAVSTGILIIATSPDKRLTGPRNAQRTTDIAVMLQAISAYMLANHAMPSTISLSPTEICMTHADNCTGLTDLTTLTSDKKYLTAIPIDPLCSKLCKANGTGYSITRDSMGKVTVSSMHAEDGVVLSGTN